MSKQNDLMEQSQNTVEAWNDQANSAAKSQPAKKVPSRNEWVEKQSKRTQRTFDQAKREGKL